MKPFLWGLVWFACKRSGGGGGGERRNWQIFPARPLPSPPLRSLSLVLSSETSKTDLCPPIENASSSDQALMPLSPTYCVLRGQKGLGGLGTSCSSGLFLFSGLRRHRQGGKMVDVLANLKVGFIGGGNMARAIAEGFISSGVISPIQITVSATTDKTLASWKVRSRTEEPRATAFELGKKFGEY